MSLLFRGIVWFGVYLTLALLPLTIAFVVAPASQRHTWLQDFVSASGLVAFALSALELTLVSRFRAAAEPFGTDALMLFHRWMGIAAISFALLHGAMSLAATGGGYVTLHAARVDRAQGAGMFALAAGLLLIVTSIARKRLRLSYERWQWLHGFLTVGLLLFGLLHALWVNRYTSVPAVRGALIGYTLLVGCVWFAYRVLRPAWLARRPWEVADNQDIGGDTRLLRVRPVGHQGLQFAAGQFVWLLTGRSPLTSQQHPITIASSAEPRNDGAVELAIKAFGDWSRDIVPSLKPGTQVWLDGAYGALTPDRYPAQGFVLIAGGLGITPMRSILLSMRDRGDVRPVLLIYAANRPERMVFREELESLAGQISLRSVLVFENPPGDWTGERGLVTADLLRRHLPARYRRFQFFVCGPAPMMDALEDTLVLELGVPPGQVATERFNEN